MIWSSANNHLTTSPIAFKRGSLTPGYKDGEGWALIELYDFAPAQPQ